MHGMVYQVHLRYILCMSECVFPLSLRKTMSNDIYFLPQDNDFVITKHLVK